MTTTTAQTLAGAPPSQAGLSFPGALQKLTVTRRVIPPLQRLNSPSPTPNIGSPKPDLAMKSPTLSGMAAVIAQRQLLRYRQQQEQFELVDSKEIKRMQEERSKLATILDNDFYLFGDNAKKYKDEQMKIMLSPRRRLAAPQQLNKLRTSSEQLRFSYGDIIAKKSSLQRLPHGVTVLDEIEEEQLDEMSNVFKKPKASLLWGMSQGTSTLATTVPNTSFFMNDFSQFIKSDTLARESARMTGNPFGGRSSRRNSGRNSATPTARSRPSSASSQSTGRTESAKSNKFYEDDINDITLRAYTTSPSGRKVNSIYHPSTKQPTQVTLYMDSSNITNETLYTYISTEFVQELDLERCHWISNRILESIGQFCPQLTILNFQHCSQLIDRTIIVICNGCPNLISLNLGMCQFITDNSLEEVFQNCTNLKVLSVHNCKEVTGSSFHLIKHCKQLEMLDVSYCPKLSDDALQLVSEYSPHLTHLDMSNCLRIEDDGLSAIVQHCDDLETLRMVLCDQTLITKRSLSILTKYGRNLKILELTGVTQVDDDCVAMIAKFGQLLEFLSLSGCVHITDRSLRAIIEGCPNLRCCELCNCKKVSLQGMIELVHALKLLQKLSISQCNISDVELDILRNTSNRCTIVKQGQEQQKPYLVTYIAQKGDDKKKKKKKKGGAKKKKK